MIRANFSTSLKDRRFQRVLAVSVRVLGLLSVVCVLGSLALYGWKVQMETQLTGMGRHVRQINEDNQLLQVQLNRIQAFNHVEHSAQKVPQLRVSEEVIELPSTPPPALPENPPRLPEPLTDVTGY